MARILAIDYGMKRCGIAVTDPLQLIATALDTIDTPLLESYILKYCSAEPVEKIIFGLPTHADGNDTSLTPIIRTFQEKLQKLLPAISFDFQDEAFSSSKAKDTIFSLGIKKKQRRDKRLVDKISSVIILQEYLGHHIY